MSYNLAIHVNFDWAAALSYGLTIGAGWARITVSGQPLPTWERDFGFAFLAVKQMMAHAGQEFAVGASPAPRLYLTGPDQVADAAAIARLWNIALVASLTAPMPLTAIAPPQPTRNAFAPVNPAFMPPPLTPQAVFMSQPNTATVQPAATNEQTHRDARIAAYKPTHHDTRIAAYKQTQDEAQRRSALSQAANKLAPQKPEPQKPEPQKPEPQKPEPKPEPQTPEPAQENKQDRVDAFRPVRPPRSVVREVARGVIASNPLAGLPPVGGGPSPAESAHGARAQSSPGSTLQEVYAMHDAALFGELAGLIRAGGVESPGGLNLQASIESALRDIARLPPAPIPAS